MTIIRIDIAILPDLPDLFDFTPIGAPNNPNSKQENGIANFLLNSTIDTFVGRPFSLKSLI